MNTSAQHMLSIQMIPGDKPAMEGTSGAVPNITVFLCVFCIVKQPNGRQGESQDCEKLEVRVFRKHRLRSASATRFLILYTKSNCSVGTSISPYKLGHNKCGQAEPDSL